MSPDQPTDDRLAELRRRWEEDPGSRIFLQLAEEYRRAERYEEAVEVLTKGLESHPQQVSALVALGRSRLALGQPAEAAEALEKAVAADTTNLAAMKLSVEAYLQQGDRENARQRLELYKLLNEGDEEIEELEARLGQRAAPPPPPGETADAEEPAAAEEPAPDTWSATGAWPGLPQGTGDLPTFERASDGDEPFGDLASEGERRLYLAGLRSEGLFSIGVAEEEVAAADAVPGPRGEGPTERPTVTLGNLYLEQGHHREAVQIFETLLEADPDNAAARAGLLRARAAVARAEEAEEAAEQALAAAHAEPVPTEPPTATVPAEPPAFTLTARQLLAEADPALPPRVGLLRAYLQRIRNSS